MSISRKKFIDACINNNLDTVKIYIETNSIIINNLINGLCKAVDNNNLEIIQYLLENIQNNQNSTKIFKSIFESFNIDIYNLFINIINDEVKKEYITYMNKNIDKVIKNNNLEIVKIFHLNGGSFNEHILHKSISYVNLIIFKYMFENSLVNINYRNSYFLRHSIESDNIEVVKYLIEKGANIKTHKNYPSFEMIKKGNIEILNLLIDKGVDIKDILNISKNDEFFVNKNNIQLVIYLINEYDIFSIIWLESLVRYGSIEDIEYLLNKYINNETIIQEIINLTYSLNRKDLINLLETQGLEITEQKIIDNYTKLLNENRFSHNINYLYNYMNYTIEYRPNIKLYELGNKDKIVEICCNNTELLKYYINHGFDVNYNNGRLLSYNNQYGTPNIIKYLIDKGANITKTINNPLIEFIRKYPYSGMTDIIKYYIDNGVDINIIDETYNTTPLLSITNKHIGQHYNEIKYLLENNADIHLYEEQLLLNCIKKDDIYLYYDNIIGILNLFVEYGINININNGILLIKAIQKDEKYSFKRIHLITELIRLGANININNGEPLKEAINQNRLDIIKLFIENGVIINNDIISSISSQETLNYINTLI